jgi:hypothetical protein
MYFPSLGSHFTWRMNEYVSFGKEIAKAHHLVAVLEARERHLSDRVLLVVGLLSRQEGCIGGEGEVNTREAVFCLRLDGLCHQMIHHFGLTAPS